MKGGHFKQSQPALNKVTILSIKYLEVEKI